jgi:hypothetical protein
MKRIRPVFLAVVLLLCGLTTSHAALYFPHVDTTAGGWQTEICVINPSATDAIGGTLERYRDDGTLAASMPLSVAPHARRQIDLSTTLTSTSPTGYVVFQNTSGAPVGYTKFTQIGGDRVAVPAVVSANTDNIYVTHIDWVPWWTGISLVNTTSASKTLTVRFNTGVTRTVTLAPKQHYANTITALNNNLVDTRIVSAVIENASGIVGLELFGNGNQLGGVPLASQTTTTLFYPHVDSTPGAWWTGIVAYNPSATTTAQIAVNSYGEDGKPLGTLTQPLGPGQKFIGTSTTLNLPAETAWFSLQSQIPLVGFELFGTADFSSLAGYSVVDLEGKSGALAKVEKNGWTGLAFVNTEDQPATITINVYSDTGALLGWGTGTMDPHEKWVGSAEDFFSGITQSSATYLNYSADRNVAAFQLNGSGSMLDALPAIAPGGQKIIDKALGFLQYQSTLTSGMSAVTDILNQITGSGGSGTCPQVTANPSSINASALPPTITVTVDYGTTGCTPSGSTDVMSGKVVLAITNLTGDLSTSLSLDYALTATNLKQNGKVVMNGAVSGHIAMSTTLNASVHFNNFQVGDHAISGDMTISATDLNNGPITITLTNLTAAGYTVSSGTLTYTTAGSPQLNANLNTSQGAVNITLSVQSPSDTRVIVSTPNPGVIAGYTVSLNGVTMDSTCANNPIGGSITVSQGGSTVTNTFTAACVPVPATPVVALQEFPRQVVRALTPRTTE